MIYEITTMPQFAYLEDEMQANMRCTITLTFPVSRPILRMAAKRLLETFPFLAVRLEPQDDRIVLNTNPDPFAVTEGPEPLRPCSEQAHGYLLSISYEKNEIHIAVSHALTDGTGVKTIMHYLVNTYFTFLLAPNEKIESDYDYSDPFECVHRPKDRFPFNYENALPFDINRLDEENVRNYTIYCKELQIKEYAKHFEGSFVGVIVALFARSFLKDDSFVISCPMNMRSMLGSKTLRNCCTSLKYPITPKMKDHTFVEQLSMLKGMLFLQTSEEYCMHKYADEKDSCAELNTAPSIDAKREILRQWMSGVHTPAVSDLGEFDFGKWNHMIKDVDFRLDPVKGSGLFVSVLRFKHKCKLMLSSTISDEEWIHDLRRILIQTGVLYQQNKDD